MNEIAQDEIKLLEDFCAAVRPPGPDRLSAARARLAAGIEGRQPSGRTRRGPGRARLLTWPRLAFTGAVAVGAATALVIGLGIPFGGGPLAPPASAAELLQHAAVAALAQPAPRDDQYIYTEAVGQGLTDDPGSSDGYATAREIQQTWQSVDGSKPSVAAMRPTCSFLGQPGEPAVNYSNCHPTIKPPMLPAPAAATYSGMETLPASPDAVLTYMNAHFKYEFGAPVPTTSDWREWAGIGVVLDFIGVVPPRLGAAMFEALAKIPGVYLLHNVADYAGRQGVAVAKNMGILRQELIFDPHTYQFLGSQEIFLKEYKVSAKGMHIDVPAGTVRSALALLKTAVVSTAPKGSPDTVYESLLASLFSS